MNKAMPEWSRKLLEQEDAMKRDFRACITLGIGSIVIVTVLLLICYPW